MASVGAAILPAFDTFDERLYPRLLACFENGLVRPMLEQLSTMQTSGFDINWAPGGCFCNVMDFCSLTGTIYPGRSLAATPSISIQIRDVDNEHLRPSSANPESWSASSPSLRLMSTFAPHHAVDIYRLSALVSPLLASMLDRISVETSSFETTHQACRIYELILNAKLDAYLDLLQVAAYHSAAARYGAFSLLAQHWPEAFGHLTVTTPLPVSSSRHAQHSPPPIDPYEHEFIPWRFPGSKKRSTNHLDADTALEHCQACGNGLQGFGLRCTLCSCAVHFNCYDSPSGNFFSQYPPESSGGTHRVAVTRFSRILPRNRGETDSSELPTAGHTFHPVS